ncbi:phytanoyl-CoA hydroxylase-interacting protein-like [Haliotis cracherodii]|uniref:phytanoyl-CoA hydroxylase-interacting protein-like n=1 Tax=Haliotis cracherodii TaxID=6455 RepID=UPI0039EA8237
MTLSVTSDYFKDLVTMMPTVKDNGGDPRCPINGKLSGVFFGVTLWKGILPTISPYGDTRVQVPLEQVFDESARLYFADFYCMSGKRHNHYVTLVLTKAYSPADKFCQQHLIPLDERNNIFLRKEAPTVSMVNPQVASNNPTVPMVNPQVSIYKTLWLGKVWVEVFYTNEVSIQGLGLTTISVQYGCLICYL